MTENGNFKSMEDQWENSCAEESNLRKKGLACKIPDGMLFKCSLYVTACWRCCGRNAGDLGPEGLSGASSPKILNDCVA